MVHLVNVSKTHLWPAVFYSGTNVGEIAIVFNLSWILELGGEGKFIKTLNFRLYIGSIKSGNLKTGANISIFKASNIVLNECLSEPLVFRLSLIMTH